MSTPYKIIAQIPVSVQAFSDQQLWYEIKRLIKKIGQEAKEEVTIVIDTDIQSVRILETIMSQVYSTLSFSGFSGEANVYFANLYNKDLVLQDGGWTVAIHPTLCINIFDKALPTISFAPTGPTTMLGQSPISISRQPSMPLPEFGGVLPPADDVVIKQFSRACIGGTFDHLHVGHKQFISCGLLITPRLLIGLTSPAMLANKTGKEYIQPLEIRQRFCNEFVKRFDKNVTIDWYTLTDGLGPYKEDFKAIIVSQETSVGGTKVNQARAEAGLPPLFTYITTLAIAEGFEHKISSTDIRTNMKDMIHRADFASIIEDWKTATDGLGIDLKESDYWLWQLIKLYMQPWRRYHTLEHIHELLEKTRSLPDLYVEDRKYLILAAFFHDAIYVPGTNQNEEVKIR